VQPLHRPAAQAGAAADPDMQPVARDAAAARDLLEEIATLAFEEREVLLLTTVDGLGYREVAAILNCSLGTVAARKYAAITQLQRRLSS
jgi:RNA polymerase sigma-70 factor, ECF subfamily